MNKDVLIRITSIQIPEGEDALPEISLLLPGSYYQRNGCHYLHYEESIDGLPAAVSNFVKLKGDNMEVRKNGAIRTRMAFSPGSSQETLYATDFGTFSMELCTSSLTWDRIEHGLTVQVVYTLSQNKMPISECRLRIDAMEAEYASPLFS
ncbi:MAG: DUF1934 domain-containing protein [Blautia sp.]|nr:DUF1934 domain-containing protein [Blautia sp.]